MLNRSASLTMPTSVLKALPGKLDIKRHSPSILYISVLFEQFTETDLLHMLHVATTWYELTKYFRATVQSRDRELINVLFRSWASAT